MMLRTNVRVAFTIMGLAICTITNGQVVVPGTIPPADTPVVLPVPVTIPPADSPAPPPLAKPNPVARVEPSRGVVFSESTALPQMIADARTAYARIRDYVCHYIRRESVAGRVIPEQRCVLRVRTQPLSVAVEVVEPKEYARRETSFITGRNLGKVWFRDGKSSRTLRLDADDPRVLLDTRHTISETGILAVIDRVERSMRIEQRLNNPVQVLVSDSQYAGRACRRYEIFCDRPHALRYAARQVVFVDTETQLPIRYEAYGPAVPGGTPGGELIESQSFVGLKLNQGIGDAAFER